VELLLELVRDLSKRDPSPALRERLSGLAFQRLRKKMEPSSRPLRWVTPILSGALLIFLGISGLYVAYRRPGESPPAEESAKAHSFAAAPGRGVSAATITRPSKASSPAAYHAPTGLTKQSGPERMTLRLPYSNGAIENGTQATIRVSMSQSDLLSLGFPVNATLQDGRIVAELTLGDDGLPRAISLRLPLEVMKEKK
jgi:hypothetical protein